YRFMTEESGVPVVVDEARGRLSDIVKERSQRQHQILMAGIFHYEQRVIPDVEVMIGALLDPLHRLELGGELADEAKVQEILKGLRSIGQADHLDELVADPIGRDDLQLMRICPYLLVQ